MEEMTPNPAPENTPAVSRQELIFAICALICGAVLCNFTFFGGFNLGFAIATVLTLINEDALSEQASIHHLHAKQLPNNCYRVTFQAKFGGGRGKQRHQHFFQTLVSAPEIQSVQQTDAPARSGHK